MKNFKIFSIVGISLIFISTNIYARPLRIFKNSAQKSSSRMYDNPIKTNPNRVDAFGRP